ncbi:MAG: hypothetical protein OXF48_05120 [Bacteroidetes bacterium]|nr:hypothetical protein [Bacteroidota bacterium]
MSLSSSPRPKPYYRGIRIQCAEDVHEAADEMEFRPENEARLLLSLLTYQLMHMARNLYHSPPTGKSKQAQASILLGESSNPGLATNSGEGKPIQEITAEKVALEGVPDSNEESHLHILTFRLYLLKVGATTDLMGAM